MLKIAVVFNFVLQVILIRCFRVIIPQPVVDTFLLLSPVKYPYEPTQEIGRIINLYSFTYNSSPTCLRVTNMVASGRYVTIYVILMIRLSETKVDYFWFYRYSYFSLLNALNALPFYLKVFVRRFFFWLGIAILIHSFQTVRMFLVFLGKFFPDISLCNFFKIYKLYFLDF